MTPTQFKEEVKETNINDANVRIYFNFIRTNYVIHISKKIQNLKFSLIIKHFP